MIANSAILDIDVFIGVFMQNVQCDATALTGGVDGWLSVEWKVGIHDLFEFLLPEAQPLKPPGMVLAEQALDSYVVMTNHPYLKILTASRGKPFQSLPTRSRPETRLILKVSRRKPIGSLPTRSRPRGSPAGMVGEKLMRPTPNELFCYVFERLM